MSRITSPSQLNKENIEKILQIHFKDDNLTVSDVKDNGNFLGENDNFASEIKSWTVTTLTQDGTEENQVYFVVKSSINAGFHKHLSPVLTPFAKEMFWFKRALPTLAKLCPEVTELSPECYYGYSNYDGSLYEFKGGFRMLIQMITKKKEIGILLLENLRHRQPKMKMMDKCKLMTVNQVRLVLQTLARLHGSFLKWQNSAEKSKLTGITEKDIRALHVTMRPWMAKGSLESSVKGILQLLKNFGKSEEFIQRWEKYSSEKMMGQVVQHYTTANEKTASPIITLCHGDTWTNNMLFSEDESQVVLLDYQLMFLAHPARDIWYFMSITTDAEFRLEHLKTVLKDYFDVLNPYLESANIKITFEQFEKEMDERRVILIYSSAELVPFLLSNEKVELTNFSSVKTIQQKRIEVLSGIPKPDDNPMITEIRRRILGMVEEAANCGVF